MKAGWILNGLGILVMLTLGYYDIKNGGSGMGPMMLGVLLMTLGMIAFQIEFK